MKLDEFSVPDGTIDAEDRTRFSCVGFDIVTSAPPVIADNSAAMGTLFNMIYRDEEER